MTTKNMNTTLKKRVGILFLHGFTSTPHAFRDIEQELIDLGFITSCPLMAGHGTSPEDLATTTWKDWYISAHEAYNELAKKVDEIFIIGASMGASLACLLGAEEKATGLVIIGYPRRVYHQTFLRFVVWVMGITGHHFYQKSKKYLEDDESMFGGSKQSYHKIPLSGILNMWSLNGPVCDAKLPLIEAPTMIIHSDKDGLVKPGSANYLFKHISSEDKQLIWVHEPHHRLHLGKSKEQIYNWVKAFIISNI